MNCQQFTSLIVEAARGRLLDAAARDGAMRHAETCAACAARLSHEQSLTNALRTLADGMRDLSAPARVEAQLLAAFRESRADAQAATTDAMPAPAAATLAPAAMHAYDVTHAPITTPTHGAMHAHAAAAAPVRLPLQDEVAARRRASSPSRRQTRRTAFAATAIAASLALVALVTLYQQFSPTTPPQETARVVSQGGTESPSAVAPAVATLSPPPTPVESAGQISPGRPQPTERAAASSPRPAVKLARRAAATIIESRQVIDGGSAVFAAGDGESAAANVASGASKPVEAESVTEFISLVAGAPAATPLEGGELVRVQLPRAALASLGLPLNAERGNEPIKADVLLGNDGLARAIRFVR
jgi:hypothetical protein